MIFDLADCLENDPDLSRLFTGLIYYYHPNPIDWAVNSEDKTKIARKLYDDIEACLMKAQPNLE